MPRQSIGPSSTTSKSTDPWEPAWSQLLIKPKSPRARPMPNNMLATLLKFSKKLAWPVKKSPRRFLLPAPPLPLWKASSALAGLTIKNKPIRPVWMLSTWLSRKKFPPKMIFLPLSENYPFKSLMPEKRKSKTRRISAIARCKLNSTIWWIKSTVWSRKSSRVPISIAVKLLNWQLEMWLFCLRIVIRILMRSWIWMMISISSSKRLLVTL